MTWNIQKYTVRQKKWGNIYVRLLLLVCDVIIQNDENKRKIPARTKQKQREEEFKNIPKNMRQFNQLNYLCL